MTTREKAHRTQQRRAQATTSTTLFVVRSWIGTQSEPFSLSSHFTLEKAQAQQAWLEEQGHADLITIHKETTSSVCLSSWAPEEVAA